MGDTELSITADRWHLCLVNQEKQVGLEKKVKCDTGEHQHLISNQEVRNRGQ